MAERCSGMIRDPSGWGRHYPCSRNAKVQEEGKGWCGTHTPSKVAERKTANEARFQQKMQKQRDESECNRYNHMAGAWCRSKGMTLADFSGPDASK